MIQDLKIIKRNQKTSKDIKMNEKPTFSALPKALRAIPYPYWGKAGHGEAASHSALPVHLMAVMASFEVLMESSPISDPLLFAWGVSDRRKLMPWLCLVVALHDLGKTSRLFQQKRPDVVAWIRALGGQAEKPMQEVGPFDHSVQGGLEVLEHFLDELAKDPRFEDSLVEERSRDLLAGLFRAVFAHHGYHPNGQSDLAINSKRSEWTRVSKHTMATVSRLVAVIQSRHGGFEPLPLPSRPVAVAHLVAGLTALGDWLGSDERHFPFIDCMRFGAEFDTDASWIDLYSDQLESARARIAELGLSRHPDLSRADLAVLGAYSARPVQSAAQEMAAQMAKRGRGNLMIVEAPMGVGKTEAAFLVACEFMRQGQAAGIAFGLPAQASANMLFRRMGPLARMVFGVDQPNLAHGQSAFVRKRVTYTGETDHQEASAHLDEWITDDNKKAFLAPLCAATVDQIQLAAMHSKHGFVRYASLCRNVVVIDEVHAYDAYMQTILQSLLRLLGACGVPTVLLSATLPDVIRQKLISAYVSGAGARVEPVKVPIETYPVVVGVSVNDGQSHVEVRDVPKTAENKSVRVKTVLDQDLVGSVIACARSGMSVAVLANTVASARARYAMIRAQAPDLEVVLMHSRFRQFDRMSLQSEIEGMVGPESTPLQRAGKIIVSTQVLEQSIDIDVDRMFSEPAPIDLLLQRMGRLQRHNRPDRMWAAEFVVIAPPVDGPEPDWYSPARKYIYKEGGKLAASLALVRRLDGSDIQLPADIPRLVHEIYGAAEDAQQTSAALAAEQAALDVRINDQGSIIDFASAAMHCSKTRNSEDDGLKVLFVVENHEGDWFIPAREGLVKLPERFSPDQSGRIAFNFLAKAQQWLINIPSWSAESKSIQKRFPRAFDIDWRTSRAIESPIDRPPFFIVPVRKPMRDAGHVRFNITDEVVYSTSQGLCNAQVG